MRKSPPDDCRGARADTLSILRAAAALVATHATRAETARTIGVTPHRLARLIRDHAEEWRIEVLRAKIALRTEGHVIMQAPTPSRQPRLSTQEGIRRATAMLASGRTCEEIGQALNVSPKHISKWPRRFGELWRVEFNRAMTVAVEVIRTVAGTDAVLQDPRRYLRQARAAERWARAHDRPLFERPGEVTLRSFFRDYYKPVRLEDASPRAVADYETTLRHWMVFTGDPPLKEIGVKLLARFRDCPRAAGGRNGQMSNNAIRKHLLNIRKTLAK